LCYSFEPAVAGLGLKFDFTTVPVRHNPVADHQTQKMGSRECQGDGSLGGDVD
jgi:hypothetical protein